jgi:hypothetical protein
MPSGRDWFNPQQIARAISDHAAEEVVFPCDVEPPAVWGARYLTSPSSSNHFVVMRQPPV